MTRLPRGACARALAAAAGLSAALVGHGVVGSDVPSVPEAPGGGPCAAGFLEASPVVFVCAGASGESKYLALAGTTDTAFRVPRGVKDLRLTMSTESPKDDVDILVYDAASKKYLVKAEGGFVDDKKTTDTWAIGDAQAGLDIEYSGSRVTPETFSLTGTTPSELEVRILNRGIFPTTVTLRYSFGRVEDCEEPWLEGCKAYNAFDTQRVVVDWSIWVAAAYGSAEHAWSELASSMAEGQEGWPADMAGVPFYKWSYVWKAWRMAEVKGPKWQDAFRYIGNGDAFITKSRFAQAFEAANVSAAVDACAARLRGLVGDAAEARQRLSGDGGSGATEFVRTCSQTSGFSAEQLDVFVSGLDGHRGFSEDEFNALWDRQHLCPAGHFRSESIIYTCHPSFGRVDFAVGARSRKKVAQLRKGMRNIEIGFQAGHDLDLLVRDPAASIWVVRPDGGVVDSEEREGTYADCRFVFSGEDSRPPLFEEMLRIDGELTTDLVVEVENPGAFHVDAVLVYAWDRIQDDVCIDDDASVPRGCRAVNERAAADAKEHLSKWLLDVYKTPSKALDSFSGKGKGLPGLRLLEWHRLWRAWPSHHGSGSSPEETFFLTDRDQNGVIDSEEFGLAFRLNEVSGVLQSLFNGLHAGFPDWEEAWQAVANEDTEVDSAQWERLVSDLLVQQELPGGSHVCEAPPEMRAAVYSHIPPLDFGDDKVRPRKIGLAEDLGIVGGSFTVMARVFVKGPMPAKLEGPVLGAPDVSGRKALFIGLEDARPKMSVGGSECLADIMIPPDELVDVAWVFDAGASEQRLFVDGSVVKVCAKASPFVGFGVEVWLGLGPDPAVAWSATVGGVQLYPAALPAPELASVFKYTPRWSRAGELEVHGEKDAVQMGGGDFLGVSRRSFSVTFSFFREQSQGNSFKDVYTLLGTPEDNSFEVVLWNGKLGISFGGSRCASELPVPQNKWVQAAFVYDAERKQQTIYQGGQFAKRCKDVEAYDGADKTIWIGKSGEGIGPWQGQVRDVAIFDHSECGEAVHALFGLGPSPSGSGRRLAAADAPTKGPPLDIPQIAADTFRLVDGNHDGRIQRREFFSEMERITGEEPPAVVEPAAPQEEAPAPVPAAARAPGAPRAEAPPPTPAPPATKAPAPAPTAPPTVPPTAAPPTTPTPPTPPTTPATPSTSPAAPAVPPSVPRHVVTSTGKPFKINLPFGGGTITGTAPEREVDVDDADMDDGGAPAVPQAAPAPAPPAPVVPAPGSGDLSLFPSDASVSPYAPLPEQEAPSVLPMRGIGLYAAGGVRGGQSDAAPHLRGSRSLGVSALAALCLAGFVAGATLVARSSLGSRRRQGRRYAQVSREILMPLEPEE